MVKVERGDRDRPLKLDLSLLKNINIKKPVIEAQVKEIVSENLVEDELNYAAWLLKAVTVIDLTTLSGDDTRSNVTRLCKKAAKPIAPDVLEKLGFSDSERDIIRTAAVCVYPTRVGDAADAIKELKLNDKLPIAAVATGFPTGLYPLDTRINEITYAVSKGASEIDIVIDRSLVITGKWNTLYDELCSMKKACGTAHMKAILGVGDLGTLTNVYKASMVAMIAGADFIKTSTGKETVNATLPVGLVMCRAIKKFYRETGKKVGLKPAGGLKTHKDAVDWLVLVKHELGDDWLNPTLFRIGASSLLGSIEKWLHEFATDEKIYDGSRFSFI